MPTKTTDKPAKTGYEWPKPAAKVLLDYLKAEVTDAADAPNRAKPFINANGVLHMHSTDWREWLTANGMPMTKAEAAAPLRDAGLKVRAFPLPGEGSLARLLHRRGPEGHREAQATHLAAHAALGPPVRQARRPAARRTRRGTERAARG